VRSLSDAPQSPQRGSERNQPFFIIGCGIHPSRSEAEDTHLKPVLSRNGAPIGPRCIASKRISIHFDGIIRGIRVKAFPQLERRQDCATHFMRMPAQSKGEAKFLGLPESANPLSPKLFQQPRQMLSSHCRHLHISPLCLDFRFTVQHSGQPHQDDRRTSRALFCTVAYAVAILTEICRHQGDMLHRGVCHGFTPLLLRCEESGQDTAPIGGIDLRPLHLAWMDAIHLN
jgi:hypothetical protein